MRIRTSWLVLATMLALAPAPRLLAQDAESSADYRTNRLDAAHHRVAASQLLVAASTSACLYNQKSVNSFFGTAPQQTTTQACTGARLGVEYGIFNWLLVTASESYLLDGSMRTSTPTTTGPSLDVSGLSNPTFGVNGRYIGGLSGTFFGSAYAFYMPDLGTARTADSGQSGNNYSGHTALALGNNLYWVRRGQEFHWEVFASRFGASRHLASTPSGNWGTDSYLRFGTTFDYQAHVSANLYLNIGATLILPYTLRYTMTVNPGGLGPQSARQTAAYPVSISPKFEIGWRVLDQLLFYANINAASVTRDTTTVTSTMSQYLNSTTTSVTAQLGALTEF